MSEVYNPLLSSFNGLGKSSSIDFVNIGPLDKATAMSKVRLKFNPSASGARDLRLRQSVTKT